VQSESAGRGPKRVTSVKTVGSKKLPPRGQLAAGDHLSALLDGVGDVRLDRLRGRVREGAAAYFYSRDIGRIWRVAEALEYGIVGINEGIISPKSPLARSPPPRHEGELRPHLIVHWGSKYGIEEFLEVKYLCMDGIDC
jgi:hypothetical protein